MGKSKWRIPLSVFALFAIMAFAVACGDDDDDDGNGGSTSTPGGGGEVSGTITMASLQFENWDPHFSDFAQDISHHFKVWRGLYEFDAEQKPVPSMAAGEPEVSADGKTYTVKLKPDLKWSDGEPLLAKDFVAGVHRTCNPDVAGHYQYLLSNIVGCDDYAGAADASAAEKEELQNKVGARVIDDTTVEYTIVEAQPTFPILLALWMTFPVPTHKVTTVDAAWPGPLENVYNGPFMPSAYTQQSTMELVPNPNWAGAEKPKIEKLVLRYIDDLSVANNAYRSGEVDVAAANTSELNALESEFGDELVSYPATATLGLEFNLKDPIWQSKEVRLAFSQATDREKLNEVVNQGANTPTTSWMPPQRAGVDAGEYDDLIGFDEEKAKENLAAAGFPNGQGFPTFTLLLTDSATNKATGEFLQSEWERILGVKINLEFVDSATRSSRFNSMDYQMVIGGWGEDYPDPENWMLGLWETGGSINKTGTSLPQLDDLIGRAKFNTDDEQRRDLYRQAERVLLEGAEGIAPLYHRTNHFLVKPYLKGMAENAVPSDSVNGGAPNDWHPEMWSTTR